MLVLSNEPGYLGVSPFGVWEVLKRKKETSASSWDKLTLTLKGEVQGSLSSSWQEFFENDLSQTFILNSGIHDITGRWYVDSAQIDSYVGPIAIASVVLKGHAYSRDPADEEDLSDYLGVLKILPRSGQTSTRNFPGIYSTDVPSFDTGGYPIDLIRSDLHLVYETIIHGPPPTLWVGEPISNDYGPGRRDPGIAPGTWVSSMYTPPYNDSQVDTTPFNPIYQYPNGYFLANQEWFLLGTPASVGGGLEDSGDWPRFSDTLCMVRDTWTNRRAVEPGPE